MPLHIEELNEEQKPGDQTFVFHHLRDAQYCSFGNPSVQPLLDKWGFGQDMVMCTFRVEQPIQADTQQAMLEAFFRDGEVLRVLHSLTRLRVFDFKKVRVFSEKLSTKAVSMEFFNKFEECDAISHTGHIRGRLEEDYEGVPILNMVREAILVEDSDIYDTFSSQDRKEFIFRIFSHLVFGGASNQYEDHVEEYFKVTKDVYKDLLTVRRTDTGDVEVVSHVVGIRSLGDGGQLYPKDSLLNFCYVISDPLMRHIKVWYFGFRPIW
eukprot:TRINITY_DN76996_c0_g1_i1.p1 TRINITY_DN76996_c0_g1~~TRINITY_DN76996_c0_g1_i1.p1  ORF type:complete len:266 (+),score=57.03 TRINITY_DN76996_c0_g1_i1:127-924(+)